MSGAKEAALGLLRSRKEAGGSIDWLQQRQEWVQDLAELYALLSEWMGDATSEDLLIVKEDSVVLTEEHLGKYQAPALRIELPDSCVRVRPVGRLIVGAQGRVDLERSPRRVTLLRMGPGDWAVASLDTRRDPPESLTQETFWKAFEALIR
ncbi:MAG: hypothetical protein VCC00_12120 [Deltaproteobacteria bacterium]